MDYTPASIQALVLERVQQVMVAQEPVKLTDRLKETLGADDIDKIEVCMDIEEALNIHVDEQIAYEIVTVQGLVDYFIWAKLGLIPPTTSELPNSVFHNE